VKNDVITAVFIVLAVVGFGFSLSGALGILRMPDLYSRIQCSSKTITMGALPALVALVVGEGIESSYAARALIVAFLLLVVNPAASHALARSAYRVGVPMWPGAVRDEAAGLRAEGEHDHGGDRGDGHGHEDGRGRGDGQAPVEGRG
jgi:multicomponent Na+:H+ antiporter subunit G